MRLKLPTQKTLAVLSLCLYWSHFNSLWEFSLCGKVIDSQVLRKTVVLSSIVWLCRKFDINNNNKGKNEEEEKWKQIFKGEIFNSSKIDFLIEAMITSKWIVMKVIRESSEWKVENCFVESNSLDSASSSYSSRMNAESEKKSFNAMSKN